MAASVLEIFHVGLPPSPGSVITPCREERRGGQAEEEASLGRPSSLAPPLLVCPPLSPESSNGNPSKEGLIPKVTVGD